MLCHYCVIPENTIEISASLSGAGGDWMESGQKRGFIGSGLMILWVSSTAAHRSGVHGMYCESLLNRSFISLSGTAFI
jgi:hypothetical protein